MGRLARPVIGTGFIGAYTTFSTFMVEAVLLYAPVIRFLRWGTWGQAWWWASPRYWSACWSHEWRYTQSAGSRRRWHEEQCSFRFRGAPCDQTHSANDVPRPRRPERPGNGGATRARKAKLAGLTVFEANEGFGNSGVLHRSHLMSDDTPLAIVIVDAPEKIDSFVASVGGLLSGIRAVLEDVEVIEV